MIPLRDENPSSTVPFVTHALIAANVAVFVYELLLGPLLRPFFAEWALVPARLTLTLKYHPGEAGGAVFTILSSMFLHGGWSHLLGNMWYLWIFGDNVEDTFGHLRFLLFYLACGVMAALLHTWTNPASELPTVGASGAIAGVLGAYGVAFPRARVITLIPFFPFFQVAAIPAMLVLGLWFVLQFLSGLGSLGAMRGGGIAFWAHIGGFLFGVLAMRVVAPWRRARQA